MSTSTISTEAKDLSEISECFEEDLREKPVSWAFANIDYEKYCLAQEIECKKTRKQLQRHPAYNHQMRSEFTRLKSFISWIDVSAWSPQEMASAGFASTGLNNSIQCFCCGLVLCVQRISLTPLSTHRKIHPNCDFIQGKEVGNIPKYEVRVQFPEDNAPESAHIYTAVEQRLASFKSWPFYAKTEPATLARAGFFFTGRKDTVHCFSCKGCLGNWEESDDPWKEHAKWFPECGFLRSEKTEIEIEQYIQDYHGFKGVTMY